MNKALVLALLFLIPFTGAIPSVTITNPALIVNETINLEFSVQDASSNNLNASFSYDTDSDASNGMTLIDANVALDATNCASADFSFPQICNFSWNTTSVADGTYYFYVFVINDLNIAEDGSDFSDSSFTVDNNPPVTSSNAPVTDQNSSFSVTLTCNDSGSGCVLTQYRIDGNVWMTYSVPIVFDIAGTFSLDFNSTDNAGNIETTNNVSVTFDNSAPSSGSVSLPAFTNDSTPSISLNSSGADLMRFSCNNSNFSSPVSYSSSFDGFDILSGSGCSSGDGSKTIYAQFGDNAGNWSASSSGSTTFDNSSPGIPTIDLEVQNSNNIVVTWNSVSDNGPAGIEKYEVRLDNGSWNNAGTSTSYTFNNASNGTHNVYLRAVDRAGNISNESTKSISTTTSCTLNIDIDSPAFASPNQSVIITVSSNNDMVDADFFVDSDSGRDTLKSNYNGKSFSVSHTFGFNDEGIATFELNVEDSGGRSCDTEKDIIIDGTVPVVVEFDNPSNGAVIEDVPRIGLIVRARDDQSGVNHVDLHYRKVGASFWTKITTVNTNRGNIWDFSWSLAGKTSGDYEIRATAVDFADNESIAIINISLSGLTAVSEQVVENDTNLDSLLEQIGSLKIGVQKLIDFLHLVNIPLGTKIETDLSLANSKHLEAQNSDDENKAIIAANKAKDLFTGLSSMIGIYDDKSTDYFFDAVEFDSVINSVGLHETSLISQTKELRQNISVNRRLKIERVVVNNETFYSVGIILLIENNENIDKSLKVVEVVPKSFADSALNLSSAENFSIISEDPIIQFSVFVPANESIELKYFLANHISLAEADELISSNVIQEFNSPALLFYSDQEISSASFEPIIDTGTATGLFSGFNFELLTPIGIIISIIVVIALVGFFISNREPSFDSPLGNPKFSTKSRHGHTPKFFRDDNKPSPSRDERVPKWGFKD